MRSEVGLGFFCLLLIFPFGSLEECAQDARCSEIPLELIRDTASLSHCWEECTKNRECLWYTFWKERNECFLFRECGQLLVECEGCQSGQVTCAPKEGFQLLVFGGYESEQTVQLFPSLTENSVCQLSPLPESARFKPFGGFMEQNLTVCAGGLQKCYYASEMTKGLTWSPSFQLDLTHSSLVTTMDDNIWSFFGGGGYRYEIHTWSQGMESFQKHEQDYYLDYGLCSARKNQTHVIISKGSKNVFWYREEGMYLNKWEDGPSDVQHTGCGLSFDSVLGYEFVSAGGRDLLSGMEPTDSIDIYNFDQDIWLEGPRLPQKIRLAASVPYQNGFLLVGGYAVDKAFLNTIYEYHRINGWTELPIRLIRPDGNVGAMRISKEKLQCP